MSLDFPREEFRELLHLASDAVVELYDRVDGASVFHGKSPQEVRDLFEEEMPKGQIAPRELIERFTRDVVGSSTLNISPDYYGYIVSAGNQMAVITALLQAGANLCGAKWDLSAATAEIETNVIKWMTEFIGFGQPADGVLTSGGSAANLVCLLSARRAKRGQLPDGLFAERPLAVYGSTEVHSCFESNVDLMGIGSQNIRRIPTDARFRIDCAALEESIERDLSDGVVPFCVIGNAGATNTGAIDDLVEISRICKQYDIWFHVDGAYGAPAARSDLTRDLFAGLASANSVALDPHKWLYVPVECGCALIRGRDDLKSTFELVPDYLRQMSTDSEETGRKDWYTRTFQTTRDAKALRVWATFLAYGADGLLSEIENNIRTMRELGEKISQSSDFELLAPVVLSTICFRYISDAKEVQADENELNSINRELIAAIETDGRVFVPGTRVHGKIALRACTVNHRNRREHADRMLNSIRELAQSIVAQRRVGGHR